MTAPCAIEYILVTRWRGGKKGGQNRVCACDTRDRGVNKKLQGRPRIAKPRMMKENGAKKRTAHTGSFRQQTQRTRGDAKKNNAAKWSRLF